MNKLNSFSSSGTANSSFLWFCLSALAHSFETITNKLIKAFLKIYINLRYYSFISRRKLKCILINVMYCVGLSFRNFSANSTSSFALSNTLMITTKQISFPIKVNNFNYSKILSGLLAVEKCCHMKNLKLFGSRSFRRPNGYIVGQHQQLLHLCY